MLKISLMFSHLKFDDSLAIRCLNFLGRNSAPYNAEEETFDFLTILYIAVAAISATFSIRAAATNIEVFIIWAIYSTYLTVGIGAVALMGNRAEPQRVNTAPLAVAVGMIGASIILAMQYSVSLLSNILLFSTTNAEMALLAPVSETLFFTCFLYRLFRVVAPELSWLIGNTFSSFWFASYHYFVYGLDPMSWIVLFVGNSVLNYTFEVTKNPAAPMTAHLLVNMTPYWGLLAVFFMAYWWMLVIPVILVFVFIFVGVLLK